MCQSQVLINTDQDDDDPDDTGAEGTPLDTRQWELSDKIPLNVICSTPKSNVWFGK